ncbi:MAG: hypothetical protein ACK4QW_11510 [Alphaproteobacteria bacterium]
MGLSLGKILVLVLILAAVWYGFRVFHALQDAQRRRLRERRDAERVVELERNPRTGAYEPRRGPDRRDR